MKLDEFVKQSLLDITNGVTAAQDEAKLYIAPGFVEGQKLTKPQMVSFEVVVTTNKNAEGGIRILTFGDAKLGGTNNNTNKIAFQVPVYFQAPTDKNSRHHTRASSGGGGDSPFGPKILQDKEKYLG